MNTVLEKIPIINLITPGEMYIFHKSSNPWAEPGPIIYMYFVKSDEEIMPAIDMEVSYNDDYILQDYIGSSRISPTCIEFKFCSYDTVQNINIEHSLYLHRIKTVQDSLQEAALYHQKREKTNL